MKKTNSIKEINSKQKLLQQIPNVNTLLFDLEIQASTPFKHEALEAIREYLDRLRSLIAEEDIFSLPVYEQIKENIITIIHKKSQAGIKRVINGTGVILHSNLGRACLSKSAADTIADIMHGYCTLEYDILKGERGSRAGFIEDKLKQITGCEAAAVVNNNAAAMLLILCSVASGGNVIVSRGELVEIGGGFRIPEILDTCGCKLCEVGTTNKTRLSDYENAIDENTVAILKVHCSNFKIIGFTQSVTIKELSQLSGKHNIPLIEDIGSGALINMSKYGIVDEPLVSESLKDRADIVSFSGDKLLGGPQCGIILGSAKYLDKIKKHPLYRALRIDKMTVAALEATLRFYQDPSIAEKEIPVLSMLSLTPDELRLKAEELCERIMVLGGRAEIVPVKSTVGGGSAPGVELDSFAVTPINKLSANETEEKLRANIIPIIGRIEKDNFILDVRTIFEEDFDKIARSLSAL